MILANLLNRVSAPIITVVATVPLIRALVSRAPSLATALPRIYTANATPTIWNSEPILAPLPFPTRRVIAVMAPIRATTTIVPEAIWVGDSSAMEATALARILTASAIPSISMTFLVAFLPAPFIALVIPTMAPRSAITATLAAAREPVSTPARDFAASDMTNTAPAMMSIEPASIMTFLGSLAYLSMIVRPPTSAAIEAPIAPTDPARAVRGIRDITRSERARIPIAPAILMRALAFRSFSKPLSAP